MPTAHGWARSVALTQGAVVVRDGTTWGDTCREFLKDPGTGIWATVYIGERAFGYCLDDLGETVPNCSYFLADEATCDTEDGVYWDYTDVITLCGDVCDEFKQAGTMDVTYGWLCE